jgi:hypothetical protein
VYTCDTSCIINLDKIYFDTIYHSVEYFTARGVEFRRRPSTGSDKQGRSKQYESLRHQALRNSGLRVAYNVA